MLEPIDKLKRSMGCVKAFHSQDFNASQRPLEFVNRLLEFHILIVINGNYFFNL